MAKTLGPREELKIAWDIIAKIQRDLIDMQDREDILKYIAYAALQKAHRDRPGDVT